MNLFTKQKESHRCRKQSYGYQGGWEGDERGKRYGDICICITDTLCYTAETNTTL